MVLKGVDAAVVRNVAGLHWAMRQNIEETFRRLEVALGRRIDEALLATRGVMLTARDRRSSGNAAAADAIEAVQASLTELSLIRCEAV